MLLAVGILATLFVTLGLLFLSLLRGSAKSTNTAVGAVFAEDILETVIRENLYDTASGPRSEGIYTVSKDNLTNFFYTVESEQVSRIPTVHAGGYLVTVKVWWWSGDPDQVRDGHGRLSTQVSRLHLPGSQP